MIKTYSAQEVDPQILATIQEAKQVALQNAFPRDKNVKVGCVLETPQGIFKGANISRWSWNNNTCAERMAIDQALHQGVSKLNRITVYGINQENPSSEVTSPCGPCREIIKEALEQLSQADVEIVMANAEMSKITIANLTDLLPL